MISEVIGSPPGTASSSTWRGGSSQPVANIARRSSISAANGSAVRVDSASNVSIGGVAWCRGARRQCGSAIRSRSVSPIVAGIVSRAGPPVRPGIPLRAAATGLSK